MGFCIRAKMDSPFEGGLRGMYHITVSRITYHLKNWGILDRFLAQMVNNGLGKWLFFMAL